MKLRLLNTSERMTFKRCRQKWYWGYVLGLKIKRERPALMFGDLIHQALAAYYKPGVKRGPHPSKTFTKLYQKQLYFASGFGVKDIENEEWVEAGELGVAMLNNYVDTYGNDGLIEIIAPEHPFAWPYHDSTGKLWIYVGRFDAVIRWVKTGEVGLFEHKTAGSISDAHLQLDEQAGSYWAFAMKHLKQIGILKKNQELDMILYNFLRKSKPDERPRNKQGLYLNKDGSISKKQPTDYFLRVPVYRDEPDRRTVLRRIRLESTEMRMARTGKLAIYKNPTKDCSWDCPFYGPCELHETGDDYKEVLRQNYIRLDPHAGYKSDLSKEIKEAIKLA